MKPQGQPINKALAVYRMRYTASAFALLHTVPQCHPCGPLIGPLFIHIGFPLNVPVGNL